MLEQLREYPEIAELLLGLAQAAPAYAGALRLNEMSPSWQKQITHASLAAAPAYRDQIGEKGKKPACAIPQLLCVGCPTSCCTHPVTSVDSAVVQKRIGQNIRTKPESFDASGAYTMHNLNEVLSAIRHGLDSNEADTIEAYVKQAFASRSNAQADSGANPSRRLTQCPPVYAPAFGNLC